MYKFPGIFAFGTIMGIVLQESVSGSLARRGHGQPGGLLLLPFASGILYAGTFALTGCGAESLLCCFCVSALLGVGIIDSRTLEIPWEYNLLIGTLGLFRMLVHISRWYEYFAGFFAVSSLLLFVYFFTGGKGIGGGDIKLMAAAGLFLGWEKVLQAFLLGGIIGTAGYALWEKRKKESQIFALGPGLAIGIFFAMIG